METILITGANGFIGRALCEALLKSGYAVHAVVRQHRGRLSYLVDHEYFKLSQIGDMTKFNNWPNLTTQCDYVIHTAALVYQPKVMNASLYESTNVSSLVALTDACINNKVKSIILLSSAAVYGACAKIDATFSESDILCPNSLYAISKVNAERMLQQNLIAEGSTKYTIIRPPFVIGETPRGNLTMLLKVLRWQLPLPFAAINNRRSFISIVDLVNFILLVLTNDKASNEIFNVAFEQPFSINELLEKLADHKHLSCKLFRFPKGLVKVGTRLMGKTLLYDQFYSDHQLDVAKAWQVLGWKAKQDLVASLSKLSENKL